MKYPKNIIGVISCLVIFVVFIVWLNKFRPHSSKNQTTSSKSSTWNSIKGLLPSNGFQSSTNQRSLTSPLPALVDPKVWVMEMAWSKANSKSLDFYGLIVDQKGKGVSGVSVTAKVGLYLSMSHSGAKEYVTRSDSDGNFSFVGIHGAGVRFVLQKEGYVYNQKQSSTDRPDDYKPDPNHRVIFKIWKLRGAEPMISSHVQALIPCDGSKVSFNPRTGRNKGDLVVSLTRNPVNIDRSRPFDWTLTLAIANGGITEDVDVYSNEAPLVGYQPSVRITVLSDSKNWTPIISGSYYFKTRQDFGRITISGTTNFQPPPTLFDADIFVNPTGSQNLEIRQ